MGSALFIQRVFDWIFEGPRSDGCAEKILGMDEFPPISES